MNVPSFLGSLDAIVAITSLRMRHATLTLEEEHRRVSKEVFLVMDMLKNKEHPSVILAKTGLSSLELRMLDAIVESKFKKLKELHNAGKTSLKCV